MPVIRVCELCQRPILDDEPAQVGLDGEQVHLDCLDAFLQADDEEER